MNRRGFVKAIAAVSVAIAAPRAWVKERWLRLYADGVHDDTEALQAALDGNPVVGPDGRIRGPEYDADGALVVRLQADDHIRVTETVKVNRPVTVLGERDDVGRSFWDPPRMKFP